MSHSSSSSPSSSSSSDRTLSHAASETTPLLSAKSADASEDGSPSSSSSSSSSKQQLPAKPLPKFQIIILCFARMMEPIAFFAIFPFIAQMVQRNGNLPDSDVGFYSGLIESVFSAAQMVVLIFWGRLADAIGRKPVLVASLVGMALATVMFTLATSIWQMILFRAIGGVLSGSGLVIRTMIGDHCTPETQARAFSWFAFASNAGIFLGPLLGGALADPVNQYPSLFEGNAFFERYPYALPGFVIGVINVVGILLCAFFLEETLKPDSGSSPSTSSAATSQTSSPAQQLSMRELIKAPGVGVVIGVYSHVMFLAFAGTSLFPISLFTPVSLGGIGFSPFRISVYMAGQGASQALWLLLAFPFLQRRLGTKRVLEVCAIVYPMLFSLFIIMNALLRIGTEPAVAWFWILIVGGSVIGPGVAMAFTGVQLALNDVAPNPHVLGTLNAMALTCASAIRSFVPGVTTAVFAVGVRHQIFWGHLAWVILIPMAAALYLAVRWLPDDRKASENDE